MVGMSYRGNTEFTIHFDKLLCTKLFLKRWSSGEDKQLIWGRDFNSSVDCKLDADGRNTKLKVKSITKLRSMMSENEFCDIFKVYNPELKCYTWHRKTPFKQRRLDYFLISDQLQLRIRQRKQI